MLLTSRKPVLTASEKPLRLPVPTELVRVTVWGLPTVPTPVCGKFKNEGSTRTEPGVPPIPLSGTLVGADCNDEATVNVPVKEPLTAGEKTTPTVQLAPAPRLTVQVLLTRAKGAVARSASELAATLAELVTVTVCAALDWPGATTEKLNCAGCTLRPVEDWPAPVSGTLVAATPGLDEEITSAAAAPPAIEGVKTTCTVQLDPLASVAPQLVALQMALPQENSLADWPVIAKPILAIGAPPVLLTVSVWAALAWPTVCAAKVKEEGLTPNAGGSRPVPARATVWVRSASVMVSVPVWFPAWTGAKTTPISQLEWAASWVVHLFEL